MVRNGMVGTHHTQRKAVDMVRLDLLGMTPKSSLCVRGANVR